MGKIIAVTNQKGGVGKTTTTVNLGAGLGVLGKKVLIVDIDPQANATQGLNLDKVNLEDNGKSSHEMMLHYDRNSEDFIVKTEYKNLYCISGSKKLAAFDVDYVGSLKKELALKACLLPLSEQFDYILIDCPPTLSSITMNGLVAADSVLVPIQAEFYALDGMTQLLQTFQMCKDQLNSDLEIEGLLVTMFSTNTNLSTSVYEEIKKFFSDYLLKTIIKRNVAIAEAPSFGEPIMYYNSSSQGAKDYMNLAKEVIENG